jgi:hypothetical protein
MAPGRNSLAHKPLLQHRHGSACLCKPRCCLQPDRTRANDGYAVTRKPKAHGPTSFGRSIKKTAVATR